MELESIESITKQLIEFWRDQKISISSRTRQEVDEIQKNKHFVLPNDFKDFYHRVNGMETLYPNEFDEEGFLFYPLEAVILASEEFGNLMLINGDRIFIFAEYMHKSWWYGVEIISEKEYKIGIIPEENSFRLITTSLTEFIDLYLKDSSRLYDY